MSRSRSCTATWDIRRGDRPRRLRGLRPRALGALLRRDLLRARRAADVRERASGRLRARPRAVLDRRSRPSAAPGYGHVALEAAGRAAVSAAYEAGLAHGGSDDGKPGMRPQYGPLYFAATCSIPTACGSSSSAARTERRVPARPDVADGHAVALGEPRGDQRAVAGLGIGLHAQQRRRASAGSSATSASRSAGSRISRT